MALKLTEFRKEEIVKNEKIELREEILENIRTPQDILLGIRMGYPEISVSGNLLRIMINNGLITRSTKAHQLLEEKQSLKLGLRVIGMEKSKGSTASKIWQGFMNSLSKVKTGTKISNIDKQLAGFTIINGSYYELTEKGSKELPAQKGTDLHNAIFQKLKLIFQEKGKLRFSFRGSFDCWYSIISSCVDAILLQAYLDPDKTNALVNLYYETSYSLFNKLKSNKSPKIPINNILQVFPCVNTMIPSISKSNKETEEYVDLYLEIYITILDTMRDKISNGHPSFETISKIANIIFKQAINDPNRVKQLVEQYYIGSNRIFNSLASDVENMGLSFDDIILGANGVFKVAGEITKNISEKSNQGEQESYDTNQIGDIITKILMGSNELCEISINERVLERMINEGLIHQVGYKILLIDYRMQLISLHNTANILDKIKINKKLKEVNKKLAGFVIINGKCYSLTQKGKDYIPAQKGANLYYEISQKLKLNFGQRGNSNKSYFNNRTLKSCINAILRPASQNPDSIGILIESYCNASDSLFDKFGKSDEFKKQCTIMKHIAQTFPCINAMIPSISKNPEKTKEYVNLYFEICITILNIIGQKVGQGYFHFIEVLKVANIIFRQAVNSPDKVKQLVEQYYVGALEIHKNSGLEKKGNIKDVFPSASSVFIAGNIANKLLANHVFEHREEIQKAIDDECGSYNREDVIRDILLITHPTLMFDPWFHIMPGWITYLRLHFKERREQYNKSIDDQRERKEDYDTVHTTGDIDLSGANFDGGSSEGSDGYDQDLYSGFDLDFDYGGDQDNNDYDNPSGSDQNSGRDPDNNSSSGGGGWDSND